LNPSTTLRAALLLTLVALFASAPRPAAAQPGPQSLLNELHGRFWAIPQVRERLSLTAAQVERLDEVFLAHQTRLIDLKAEVDKRHLQLGSLMADHRAAETEIFAAIDALENARAEPAKSRARMMVRLREVLSVAQREALEELRQMAARRQRFEEEGRRPSPGVQRPPGRPQGPGARRPGGPGPPGGRGSVP
jgi:Spy/CpxP family protein refolding chaperone